MRTICLDLDEVLVEIVPALVDYYNRTRNAGAKYENILSYNLWEAGIGRTREDAIGIVKEFYNSPAFRELTPIEGAEKSVFELFKRNNVIVVTSRGRETLKDTSTFMKRYFAGVPTIYSLGFHDSGASKAEICVNLGADFFVDDCLEYAFECSKAGIRSMIFTRPWNELYQGNGLTRVKNWKEIMGVLGEIR